MASVSVAVAQVAKYTLTIIQRSVDRQLFAGECCPIDGPPDERRFAVEAGPSDARIQEVLRFWFDERSRECWFRPTPEFDQTIRKHFAELFARAATGELTGWETSAEGCLALCILLDQMPRSMFRGDRRAFVTDDRALAIAERALAKRLDQELTPERKQFLYMPFMHDETLANQLRALALFESQGLTEGRRYAEQHVAIIRRFGRFPHRNAVLGRPTTEAEAEFLRAVEQYHDQVPGAEAAVSQGRPLSLDLRNDAPVNPS
jgi:uncharacterized protein (DUF924 family)